MVAALHGLEIPHILIGGKFMRKQVYISADYSEDSGDRNVVKQLQDWGSDDLHKVDFIDIFFSCILGER